MPLLIADQLTPEWHQAHIGRITASTAAACLGHCPHTSRQKAYRMIVGTEAEKENSFMTWGKENEDKARTAYECVSGAFVARTGFWVHPEFDWLGASPDGLVNGAGLVELKCPAKLPEAVPLHHRIQCLIQLAVTGRQWCDYLAWTTEGTFCRRIHPAGTASLIERLWRFYLAYVDTGIEPERKKPKRRAKPCKP